MDLVLPIPDDLIEARYRTVQFLIHFLSFPRKREPTAPRVGAAGRWAPAFAGATGYRSRPAPAGV